MRDVVKVALVAVLAIRVGILIINDGKRNDFGWSEDRDGEPFSPASDVTCLPRRTRCYQNDDLSWRWTQRAFG